MECQILEANINIVIHTFIKYNHILLVNYTIKYFISFIINGIFMYIYVCYILFISYLILYRKCNINAYNI